MNKFFINHIFAETDVSVVNKNNDNNDNNTFLKALSILVNNNNQSGKEVSLLVNNNQSGKEVSPLVDKETKLDLPSFKISNSILIYKIIIICAILIFLSLFVYAVYKCLNAKNDVDIILSIFSLIMLLIFIYLYYNISIKSEDLEKMLPYNFKSKFIYKKVHLKSNILNLLNVIYKPLYLEIDGKYIYYINNDYDHICRLLDKNGHNTEKYIESTFDNIIVLLKNKEYRSKSIKQEYTTNVKLIQPNTCKDKHDFNISNVSQTKVGFNIENLPIKDYYMMHMDKFLIEIKMDNITYYRLLNLKEYNDIKDIL